MTRIEEFGADTVDAVGALVRANKYLQALVVLYSAIDTLAWSARNQGDVTKGDFCTWADRYMKPREQLGCTAEDLYSARCGLLHGGVAESRLSREGKAAELWYATSANGARKLQQTVEQFEIPVKVIEFTNLVGVFGLALMEYSDDLASNKTQQRLANDRIRQWLQFVPNPAQNDTNEEGSAV